MNEIGERFLPVGTVVMLKGGSKRVMIAGFCAMSEEAGEKVYDYSGCLYPEGFISSNQTCLFDHEQIEKVYFKGLIDEEEVEFKKKLNALIKQIDAAGVTNSENASVNEEEFNETSESAQSSLEDDDFIKNFPGPIDDVMKEINEAKQEPEIIEDIIDVEEPISTSSNNSIEF